MSAPQTASLFDAERLRVYPRIAVIAYAGIALMLVLSARDMIDPFGKPLGYDFITFWAASKLTLMGEPQAAFDMQRIFEAQRMAVPAGDSIFLWHYPPTFQLLAAPLALVPYVLSYFLFMGLTLAAFLLTLRRFIDPRLASGWNAIVLLVALPGVFLTLFHGQNSLLSAAIFAGALLAFEDKRPFAAGLILGLLAYKPQLGLLIPIVLVLSGQWRVFLGASVSVLLFAGLSLLVFGTGLWFVFLENAPLVRRIMEEGVLPWHKMPSAFVFLRYLHVPESIAYAGQALTALAAAASAAYVWWKAGPSRLAWAVLIVATLLLPPYLFDYEFALLALPLILLANDMLERGATRFEKAALLMFFALPLVVGPFAQQTHVQIGFPMLAMMLALCVRRACVIQSAQRVQIG